MTRALVTQMLGALRNAVPCDSKQADEQLCAITAAREYLATEPSGERAELIAAHQELNMSNYGPDDVDALNDWANQAYDMLEADVSLIGEGNKAQKDKQDWSRFHHLMKKHGLHPGRTDDDLLEILDVKLSEPAQQAKQVPMSKEELEFLVEDIAEWSLHVQVDTAPTTLTKHIEKVLAQHGIGGEA